MNWRYYNKTSPKKVKNGIKARSKRGAIGEQWWSRQWVKILESFSLRNRLQRGRRYARRGQVMDFTIHSGKVEANVQGSASKPYAVEIKITPFTKKEWNEIIKKMTEKAYFAAKLLAGEVPKNIGDVFEHVDKSLFPQSSKEIKTFCSCPDSANPCKHIAAVHYILAEKFDVDPFMLFNLRGRTKKEIITALRIQRSSVEASHVENALPDDDKRDDKNDEIKGEVTIDTVFEGTQRNDENEKKFSNFWTGGSLSSLSFDMSFPDIPLIALKKRGTPDFWDHNRDFLNVMEEIYDIIAKKAFKIAYNENDENINKLMKKRSKKPMNDLQDTTLQKLFEKKTGKHAIWGGKITKGYKKWKKKYFLER
ncbi:MAG: SWIM zinc finger family protein [Promethearchaeia archaeon]